MKENKFNAVLWLLLFNFNSNQLLAALSFSSSLKERVLYLDSTGNKCRATFLSKTK